MNTQKRKIRLIFLLIIILLIFLGLFPTFFSNKSDLKTVKNEKDLEKVYNGNPNISEKIVELFFYPWTSYKGLDFEGYSHKYNKYRSSYYEDYNSDSISSTLKNQSGTAQNNIKENHEDESEDDYSKTNVQVENVDESDTIKTDGKYIYSISDDNVIISDVKDPTNMNIISKITTYDDTVYPEELEVYKDKLVVIGKSENLNYYTQVLIYDLSNIKSPRLVKSLEINNEFETTRCIDGKFYIITYGPLVKEDDKYITLNYKVNNTNYTIPYNNLKYFSENETYNLVEYGIIDLNNLNQDINLKGYFTDIDDIYFSSTNMYFLNKHYSNMLKNYRERFRYYLKDVVFSFRGIYGLSKYEEDYYGENNTNEETEICKFNISEDDLEYQAKTSVRGNIIDRYLADEYENNFRIATFEDGKGTKIYILDKNLNLLGQTDYIAQNEKMYSARFIGNRGYLVTYKYVDPLGIVDLSNPKKPVLRGQLKISGYSTYLHPYDENHLIGIGMETKTTNGKYSNSTTITGMKMALFDVSDIDNPKVISTIKIGDKNTTSEILNNPKALLFSKEKELLAIPISSFSNSLNITIDGEYNQTLEYTYKNDILYYQKRFGHKSGYIIFNVNLKEGFKQKGLISHDDEEKITNSNKYYYRDYYPIPLRGVYIDNDLYTVSEDSIKSFNLDSLDNLGKLDLKKEKNNE